MPFSGPYSGPLVRPISYMFYLGCYFSIFNCTLLLLIEKYVYGHIQNTLNVCVSELHSYFVKKNGNILSEKIHKYTFVGFGLTSLL